MKIKIEMEGINEIEKLLALLELGLLTALEKQLLSIEDVENYLFNPYTLKKLKDKKINNKITDIIHLGTELEDVRSLIPDNLDDTIAELKNQCIDIVRGYSSLNIKANRLISEIDN